MMRRRGHEDVAEKKTPDDEVVEEGEKKKATESTRACQRWWGVRGGMTSARVLPRSCETGTI